ncbi:hypothetical protein C8R45DRAFT_781333, partial [Mycena sanguinolenta]
PGTPRRYVPRRSDEEKIENILGRWSLREFLYKLFQRREDKAPPRLNQHAQMVSIFLRGDGTYTPADIITCWMKSPYGAITPDSPQSKEMFSTQLPIA